MVIRISQNCVFLVQKPTDLSNYNLMNFSIFFKKSKYQVYQQRPDYNRLLEQIQSVVQNIPDLYSITFIGPGNLSMGINNQQDLEALFHLGGDYRIANLEIKDLVDDMFNMTIEDEKPMQVEKDDDKLYYPQQEPLPKPKPEPQQQMNYVSCDGCGASHILGVRYTCLDCKFNVCTKCQQVTNHKHNLLKIKYPDQYQSKYKCFQGLFPSSPIIIPGFQNQGIFEPVDYVGKRKIFSFMPPPIHAPSNNTMEYASLIEDMFGISSENAIEFVKLNPGLSKEQLVTKAMKMRGY